MIRSPSERSDPRTRAAVGEAALLALAALAALLFGAVGLFLTAPTWAAYQTLFLSDGLRAMLCL